MPRLLIPTPASPRLSPSPPVVFVPKGAGLQRRRWGEPAAVVSVGVHVAKAVVRGGARVIKQLCAHKLPGRCVVDVAARTVFPYEVCLNHPVKSIFILN